MSAPSITRYGATAQALHWLTATAVLAAFIYGLGGSEERVYAVGRDLERQIHESLGVLVFALVALRLAWRAVAVRPAPVPAPRWMRSTSAAVQAALYLLMFAVPITAITGAWLEGHSLTFLGGLEIAPQLVKSHELGATFAEVHTWLGDGLIWIAGLHALAALFHHFILKDGVLSSMLPAAISRRLLRSR
jgi:cytochrome b561